MFKIKIYPTKIIFSIIGKGVYLFSPVKPMKLVDLGKGMVFEM
jgi:hypothetical protein